MAKSKISKKNKSLWAKIIGIFTILFVAFWFFLPPQGDNVLGVSTNNLFGSGNKQTGSGSTGGQTGCKPMLSAITLSSPCLDKNSKPGFKSVTYTCVDGTTGSISNCVAPQRALEVAGKTCSKGSTCKPAKTSSRQGDQEQETSNSSDQ